MKQEPEPLVVLVVAALCLGVVCAGLGLWPCAGLELWPRERRRGSRRCAVSLIGVLLTIVGGVGYLLTFVWLISPLFADTEVGCRRDAARDSGDLTIASDPRWVGEEVLKRRLDEARDAEG